MPASEILKLGSCAPGFVLGFFNQFCDCIGMTKPCSYYKAASFNTQAVTPAGLYEPGGSGTELGRSVQLWERELSSLLRWEVCGYMVQAKGMYYTNPHSFSYVPMWSIVIMQKKVKKNISWKCSAQFGLVITEPETHIASWTPTVLQMKIYQSPFSLPLRGE